MRYSVRDNSHKLPADMGFPQEKAKCKQVRTGEEQIKQVRNNPSSALPMRVMYENMNTEPVSRCRDEKVAIMVVAEDV